MTSSPATDMATQTINALSLTGLPQQRPAGQSLVLRFVGVNQGCQLSATRSTRWSYPAPILGERL